VASAWGGINRPHPSNLSALATADEQSPSRDAERTVAAKPQVDRWGGQDLNLRPTDYESATRRLRDLRRWPKTASDLVV
jgi:hypothetical protein